ncbi:hypothetical protein [Halosimplex pelagicum]|uniref:Uncharacterized protein n=1 Tax=Halosimplex pelagicum TaxID=869886 RepID=A0A7D5PBK2_9EURY|nr:hypothetical protein [Halosimplex pelagicum]QLH82322.1 hypothetical protein HZS54_12170 [Halosimplex pelagicum]
MIVTVEYSDGEVTDPLEDVTDLDRDDDNNLVATFGDGSRSTFIDGSVKKAVDDEETHKIHN